MGNGGFRLVMLKEAVRFFDALPEKVQDKTLVNVRRVLGGEKNAAIFKKLENSEIWEFRTLFSGVAYRLFAFWDTDGEALVVATHGIVKKTRKTPAKEIARAEAIRKEYFNEKNKKQ